MQILERESKKEKKRAKPAPFFLLSIPPSILVLRWSRCHRRQNLINLAHNPLIHIQTINHLFLGESHPVRRSNLVRLLGAVNLLRNAFYLATRIGSGLPDSAQLGQRANTQTDLLPEVLFVLDKVQRPFGQVDDGGHGDDAGEEVRVVVQRHGVGDHLGDFAGGGYRVPRVDVEGVARGYGAVGRAAVYAAGGRGVELGVWLVEHDCAAERKGKKKVR